jgi:hypothetical protein
MPNAVGGYGSVAPVTRAQNTDSIALVDEFNQMVKDINGDADRPESITEDRFRFSSPQQKDRFMQLAAYIAANNLGGVASERFGTIVHEKRAHKGKSDEKTGLFAAVELIRRGNRYADQGHRYVENGRFVHPKDREPGTPSAEADAETSLLELVMAQCVPEKEKGFLSFTGKYYAKPLTAADKTTMRVNGEWANTSAGRFLLNAKSGLPLDGYTPQYTPGGPPSITLPNNGFSNSGLPMDTLNQIQLLSIATINLAMLAIALKSQQR